MARLSRGGSALLVAALALAAAPVGGARSAPPRPCRAVVQRGVLPSWARTGFSDPRPKLPHEVSRGGRLAALLFGDPLTAPPRTNVNNKILWVSRPALTPPAGDLRLRAQRMRGTRRIGRPVIRIVPGGPGPSLIDLPAAGCWRIDASWWGYRDQIDLRYVPRR
jgi:hypothetical protein